MPRRVADLVLLVAVVAVVLRNDREIAEVYNPTWGEAVARRWPAAIRPWIAPTLRASSDLMAALVVLTLALGVAALRRPFIPPGRRWPGRGMAAIAVAGLAIVINLIGVALEAGVAPTSLYSGLYSPHFLSNSLANCQGGPKDAILGAWSVLALAGRWRSAEVGLGRLGRLLGWCWLASIAFDLFQAMLW